MRSDQLQVCLVTRFERRSYLLLLPASTLPWTSGVQETVSLYPLSLDSGKISVFETSSSTLNIAALPPHPFSLINSVDVMSKHCIPPLLELF